MKKIDTNKKEKTAFEKYYYFDRDGVFHVDFEKLNRDKEFEEYATNIFPDIKISNQK